MKNRCKRPAAVVAAVLASIVVVGLFVTQNHTAFAEPPASQPTTAPAGEMSPYIETIPASLVTFDMVPVPAGDGVAAIYFGAHEVTWDEFYYWSSCEDVAKEAEKVDLRTKNLRPSPPYTDVDRGFGMKERPAIGLSAKAATLYCEWLSKQTGKHYRLPTRAEWQHAYQLGYGPIDAKPSPETLEAAAWYVKNADEQTHKPGTKQPTPQGIYDLLGNVAEWVTGGEEPVVVGGSFRSYARELTGTFAEPEDQSVWNQNYPNEPKSLWWYIDADHVGFRVVCEP